MVRPGRKIKPGSKFVFGENNELEASVISILENGNRIVDFDYEGIWQEVIERIGLMPLPPYITERLEEKNRYQTVYAKNDGSSAAPTAGLHFTEELLEKIRKKGIEIAEVTLSVGIGTFRPVKVENIEEHDMHTESFSITKKNADIINLCKQKRWESYCSWNYFM